MSPNDPDHDYHYSKLENGLTLLLHESNLAPVASLQIWAGVGSADERPEEAGLAHFHEHMLFKGTGRRGVGEVAGEVEGAGGRINAYTSFDVTVYYATLPASALATGLDVLCDAVRGSIFDPEEVTREQEVVIEEIRRSEDAPGHVLGDLVFREAYTTHPYRLPILGSEESVASLDRDKILDFYRRWYTPDNLTIVAAGDFDARALVNDISEQFADAAPGGARRARNIEPRHTALRAAVLRRPFESQRVELAWPSARFRDEDATHLDLLAFLLGECESSRLVRRLREEEGLVDRIDASSYTPLDRGLFSVSFESDEARSRHAVEAVAEEVERLRVELVRPEELERARNNFLSSEHFERESVSGMASKLGSFEVLGGDWRREARYFETLRQATREDLLRVAHEYLDPEQLTVGAVIPDRDDQTLDESTLAGAIEAGNQRIRSRHGAPPRIAPPSPGSAPALALRSDAPVDTAGEIHSFSLPGGATLHVAPRRSVPVVAARAAMSGGLLAEDATSSGLSCFTSSIWTRGTTRHTSTAFASAVEDLAADISGFSGRSSMGVTLEVTSDKLLPALDLFSDVLLRPGFREEDVERERRETLAAIDRREDQLAQRSFMLFTETEFPLHPYRLPMLGERPSVESFGTDEVRSHHDRLVRAPNLVMAVAGDVDPEAIAEAISTRLADLPAGPFEPLRPAADPISDEIQEARSRKDRAQAHMVLGFRGTTVDDPDRHVLEVISQLLAGQGGRLFLELRDKQSLAYSVSAMNVEGVAPGFFAVYIATAPDKVESARLGILDQLQRLVQDPPDEDELVRTKRNLTGNFVIDQQRSAARAAHIALDGLYGLGPTAHRLYPEQIAAVTREDVVRVARRIIRLDAYTLALIGPD